MGLTFRKRIRLGKGLGINLSTSGASVSTGVKGLRVTKGVIGKRKGTQLYAGGGGIYYRKTLSSNNSKNKNSEKVQVFKEVEFKEGNIDWDEVNKLRDLAFEQINKEQYPDAEKTLLKALEITDKLGGGILYEMLGDVYVQKKDHKKALDMYYKNLKMSSSAKMRKKIEKTHKLIKK